MRVADYAKLVELDDGVVRSQFSNLERIGLLRRFMRNGQSNYELTLAGLDELAQIRDDIAQARGFEI
ncbi:hypothetical protein ORI99_00640 [Alishewanella sp. SMS9]|nr:hypothetical protein [Alishewanella sp. SMS9]